MLFKPKDKYIVYRDTIKILFYTPLDDDSRKGFRSEIVEEELEEGYMISNNQYIQKDRVILVTEDKILAYSVANSLDAMCEEIAVLKRENNSIYEHIDTFRSQQNECINKINNCVEKILKDLKKTKRKKK